MIADQLKSLVTKISSLIPDPSNARKHDKKNLDAIKFSLQKFGQRKPIVVQKDKTGLVVRAGNGTLAAAIALGWDEIAAVVIEEDNVTATAYAIADNRTAELAEWDDEILEETLQSLDESDFDLEDLGFDAEDLSDMDFDSDDKPQGDPDAVPDVPKNVHNVQRGQKFGLGKMWYCAKCNRWESRE